MSQGEHDDLSPHTEFDVPTEFLESHRAGKPAEPPAQAAPRPTQRDRLTEWMPEEFDGPISEPLVRTGDADPSISFDQLGAANEADAIPMLTEVVQLPRYSGKELPQSIGEIDWPELTLRVRENVLERLLRRSEVLLDGQLHRSLDVILERASRSIASELQDQLALLIREVVARAVTEELTRVQAEIMHQRGGPREGS